MRWRKMARDPWAFWGWAVLGLGVLLLTVGIPLSIWLVQRADESAPVAEEPGDTTAPGLPSGDSATVSDSVAVEVQRAQGAPAVGGTGPEGAGQPAADSATLTDSVDVQVAEPPSADAQQAGPAGGGTGASGTVRESVQFVVRDSTGKIKEQGVAE